MRPFGVVAVLLLSACGYRAGTLPPSPSSGKVTVVDCLDVAVERLADPVAAGTAVTYRFGNRCDRSIRVDLGAVQAVGRFADGRQVALVAYDPEHVIRAGRLDPRRQGSESIEYQHPDEPAARPIEICLTLGGITGGDPRPPIECVEATP